MRHKNDKGDKPKKCSYDIFTPKAYSSFAENTTFSSDEEVNDSRINLSEIKSPNLKNSRQAINDTERKKPLCCNPNLDLIKKRIRDATKRINSSIIKTKSNDQSQENSPCCCKKKIESINKKNTDPISTSPSYSVPRNYFPSPVNSFPSPPRERYVTPKARTFNASNYPSSLTGRTYRTETINSFYPETHIPKPSRTYHTYDEEFPEYFSTTKPRDYNQTWGSTLNDTRSPRMRGDIFSSTKYSTTPSRYTRIVPTIDNLYTNPNITQRVNPNRQHSYTFNYAQDQYYPPYDQTVRSSQIRNQIPERYVHSRFVPPITQSFAGRPHSTPMQMRVQQARPQSAGLSKNLPACCRLGADRPKTAESSFNRQGYLPRRMNENFCDDNSCGKLGLVSNKTQTSKPKTNVGCQYVPSSSVVGIEEPLDTLLEIRTPHKTGGSPGTPLMLSINVSCAEKSVVITPDKGFKALTSNTSSQI